LLNKISIIAFGNGVALLLHFLLFPVIAKTVGPEIFGDYGYIYAIVQTIGFVSLFNLQKLLIASDEENAVNIFTGGVISSLLISTLFLVFNYLLDLRLHVIISVPLLFFIMVNELLISNLFRVEKYRSISLMTIFKKTTVSILLISAVYFQQSYTTMLVVTLITEILYFLSFILWLKIFPSFNLNELNIKLLYNRDFILIKSIQDILNRVSAQLPIIYVKNYVGAVETGQYYFANKMIQSPMAVVTKAIRSVVFVKLSKDIESFQPFDFVKITLVYILVAIVGLGSLFLFEARLMTLIDSSWSDSYRFFYYLFPMVVSNSMASIFRDKMLLTGKNLVLLYLDVLLTVIRIYLFYLAIKLSMPLLNYIVVMALTLIVFNFLTLLISMKK